MAVELIAEHGPDAFYKGAIADQIADEMKKHGGLITKADLANYKAVERTPISGEYRGYEGLNRASAGCFTRMTGSGRRLLRTYSVARRRNET